MIKKLKWFKDYYLKTVLLGIVGVIVLGYLCFSMLNMRKDQQVDLEVLILDDRVNTENITELTKTLEDKINGTVLCSAYRLSDQQQMSAFAVKTTRDGVDLVIAPIEEMEQMYENQFIEMYQSTEEAALCYEQIMGTDTKEPLYIAKTKRGAHLNSAEEILFKMK